MVSFNKVVVAGNLTRDPELRFTNSGVPVCGFGLAVNRVRSKNEEVNFFDISAWRELGETIANYKKKGDPVLVEGRLQFRSWEAQDGSKSATRWTLLPRTSSFWAVSPRATVAEPAVGPVPVAATAVSRTRASTKKTSTIFRSR